MQSLFQTFQINEWLSGACEWASGKLWKFSVIWVIRERHFNAEKPHQLAAYLSHHNKKNSIV